MTRVQIQISLLLTAMTISAVLILASAGNFMKKQKEIRVERTAAAAEKAPIGFILGAYEGKAALFRENSETPYQIFDIEVWLLPDADREQLEQGIYGESEEELLDFLKDWEG